MPGGVARDTSLFPTVQSAGKKRKDWLEESGFKRDGITLTDFLAVLQLDKALLSNVLRQELVK